MDQLPQNFFNWYLSNQVPLVIDNRLKSLKTASRFFNISGLAKTLLLPYRRLAVTKETPTLGVYNIFDQIIFNITSIIIGAAVRSLLILVSICALIIFTVAIIVLTPIYIAIPLFSLPKYFSLTQNTFFESDVKDQQKFTKKLASTSLFKLISTFFETDFSSLFSQISQPTTLGIKPPAKPDQILADLAKNWPPLSAYLDQKSIKQETFARLITTCQSYLESKPKAPITPIGQILSFGYTKTLERFSSPITGSNLALTPGQKATVDQIEKVLARPQNNNVLLVGEPGVGRHLVVENLASAINSQSLPNLLAKQLVLLDTIALAGTGKNLVEIKSNIETVLTHAKNAGNIILVIEQIDRITTAKDERIDLTEAITAVLKDNTLPIIGITTKDDFATYIRPNSLILNLFEKINIEEASPQETLSILIGQVLSSKEKVTLDALVEIVSRSNQLLPDRRQPEKAIILLTEIVSDAKSQKVARVDVNFVDQIVSAKTKTPLGKIGKSEAEKLKNLEAILHKRIIGQNQAIEKIARAMRRARAEIETGTRPIGSFLFLGPTGVGKTETAKALAEAYFASEEKMVRLDMSEYQGEDSLNRLIGNLNTQTPGYLASLIRDNPFGLLLIDEFEKAAQSVHNLFLQILDEGFLTDAFGKKVSFDNVIIIATSNAAAEFIREEVTKGATDLSKKLVDYVLEKSLFSPELINRFDAVVVYHPLTFDQVTQVTKLMLSDLAKRLKETKNITLEITDELAQKVASAGYDPQFGARPIRRLIADKIEDEIAKMIIDEKVKNGDKISAFNILKYFVG